MVEVKRKKGESFESMLRRFSKRMQQSGRVLEAKKKRFHLPLKNKTSLKSSALRRLEASEKRDYLIRTGQFVEEVRKPGMKR